MMTKRYELILESTITEVRRVENLVKQICRDHQFNAAFVHDVMLIITEATNNAIHHGNKLDPTKKAILICDVEDEFLYITVKDQGEGFNPDELPNPLDPENLLKPSGRGVFLMNQFAKEVKYDFSSSGTTLNVKLMIRRGNSGSECIQ